MGYLPLTELELLLQSIRATQQYEMLDAEGKNTEGKHWWLVRRELADGRTLYLYPNGGGASLGVSMTPDDLGYRFVFDYMDRPREGMRAALCWDGEGEPEGWNRASQLGFLTRRRPGGGGPETEYIDPADLERNGYLQAGSPWVSARRMRRRDSSGV